MEKSIMSYVIDTPKEVIILMHTNKNNIQIARGDA